MNFPKSRTEIMDHVAVTASDNSLSNKEKEPLVRLALMHWNHVEDKSLPDVEFEGFDLNWTSPANQLDLDGLMVGASDYIDDRQEVLHQELKEVLTKLADLYESQFPDSVGYEKTGLDLNALQNEKKAIVESLKGFGYQIIDRKVTLSLDHYGDKSALGLNKELDLAIKSDSDLEIAVDIRLSEDRQSDILEMFLPESHLPEMLSRVETYLGDDKQGFVISVDTYEDALPSMKDIHDIVQRRDNQKRMEAQERRKNNPPPEVDFSMMS